MYRIVGQRQTTQLNATGRPFDVMEVTFQTASGAVRSLRIPVERYTPEVVRAEVEAVVVDLETIAALGVEG
jgi:cbb3-type cytochrome oxidase cytochrome c subunit